MTLNKKSSNILSTPIGSLSFEAKSETGKLNDSSITICEIEPSIPDGMHVEKCFAILFKCFSLKLLKNVVFSCKWDNLDTSGYPDSGEGLDAWEWEHNGILVMIGTEDGDRLSDRLNLAQQKLDENYPITMCDNQITIVIQEFEANRKFSLHFVVAWNPAPEPLEASCWFAVDFPHKKLLTICN